MVAYGKPMGETHGGNPGGKPRGETHGKTEGIAKLRSLFTVTAAGFWGQVHGETKQNSNWRSRGSPLGFPSEVFLIVGVTSPVGKKWLPQAASPIGGTIERMILSVRSWHCWPLQPTRALTLVAQRGASSHPNKAPSKRDAPSWARDPLLIFFPAKGTSKWQQPRRGGLEFYAFTDFGGLHKQRAEKEEKKKASPVIKSVSKGSGKEQKRNLPLASSQSIHVAPSATPPVLVDHHGTHGLLCHR